MAIRRIRNSFLRVINGTCRINIFSGGHMRRFLKRLRRCIGKGRMWWLITLSSVIMNDSLRCSGELSGMIYASSFYFLPKQHSSGEIKTESAGPQVPSGLQQCMLSLKASSTTLEPRIIWIQAVRLRWRLQKGLAHLWTQPPSCKLNNQSSNYVQCGAPTFAKRRLPAVALAKVGIQGSGMCFATVGRPHMTLTTVATALIRKRSPLPNWGH